MHCVKDLVRSTAEDAESVNDFDISYFVLLALTYQSTKHRISLTDIEGNS